MDINLFVLNYINNLNELNEKNIKKINYEVKETKSTENKEVKYSKEFKEFLKTSKQKNKIDTVIDEKCEINIFEKNIIQSEEIYFNFFELDVDNKMKYILDYIKRKKYILECDIYEKIKHIIEDNDILKKYISIDKSFNIINKISFIKKIENNYYDIVFDNTKKIKKKFFN
jgi:hypothetical protein